MSLLILVVDDEPDVEVLFRQLFRRELSASRFAMEFAQSAPAGLQRQGSPAGRPGHPDHSLWRCLGQEFKAAHSRHVDVGKD